MAAVTVDSRNGEISTGPVVLTPNQADTVTFTDDVDVIEVVSDGTADLNVRLDGQPATLTGKWSFVLPAGAVGVRSFDIPGTAKVFSLIASAAVKYRMTKVK